MNSLFLGGMSIPFSAVICACAVGQAKESKLAYTTELTKWREQQETALKADEGWLSVAGLIWLNEGPNRLGALGAIRLPDGSAPANLGTLTRSGNSVTLSLSSSNKVVLIEAGKTSEIEGGSPTLGYGLKPDFTRIKVGAVTFMVIKRGERFGVRVFDKGCKGYLEFKGLQWFPANPGYRVKAKFVPYDPPKSVNITNVLGDTQPVPVVGYVEFKLGGKTCRLDAQGTGSGLFINFHDLTSGKETYPAGRFLDTDKPLNGEVWVDFNRATNPPCAFTAFATCPLPPRQNYLNIAIPAGEKTHHPVE